MDKISSPTSQTPKRFQTGSPTVPSPSFRTTATTSDTSASGTGGGANRPAPASMGTSTTVPTTSKATSGATKVPQTQGVKVSPNAASSPEESLYTCTGSNSNNNSIRVVTSENVWLEAKDEVDYVPESIRKWIMDTWDDIGYQSERPQHLRISRHELFGAASVATVGGRSGTFSRLQRAPKIMKERRLDNQVRGVLCRVTPQNYDTCCKDLLNLPIRQSDDEDIRDVVKVFFDKAVSPADRIYAKEYAALFNAMLMKIIDEEKGKNIESGTTLVSRRIRTELVTHIQNKFENIDITADITKLSSSEGDAEYREAKRSELVKGLSANINFLGHLFINTLVHEGVVCNVLKDLIGANSGTQKLVQDYEFDQFFALLTAVGPHIGEGSRIKKVLPTFVELLRYIQENHPMKRIQFKAMDLRELIERNFKKKDSMYSDNGPMTMAELNRKQAENELKKTQFGRNIQNISQTAGGGYQNTMGGVRPVNAPKVMKAGGMYGKQQEGHKGSPPSITHNNIVHGSMQWENSLEAGRAVSPPPPVTPKQQSEKLMKKLMDSLINEGQGEGNEVESLRDYVLICKGSIPVDAAETSPPATGTMTISPSIHRNTRSVCGETVGHSNVVAPRDDITKFIAEYLSQFLSSSTQEVPERSLFGLFFKSLLQGNVINRSQLNLVFTQFANEYAENRKKSYIVNLLDAIENGWPTLGPDLFNIVLNELVERRLSYKTVLRFIKMAESRFDDENFYTIKIPLTDEFNATCANDPLYVFPLRRFRTIPFIIRYGLMSQNSDDLEIKEFDDEESGEDSAKEDGIENEIDIIDKCYYDNVELRQFYHLVSETEVIGVEGKVEDGNRLEVISHYIPLETGRSNTHNSKAMNREKEIVKKFISIPFEKIRNIDYLRVMCSIFTFSRFDRDVMASLMKSMLLLIKAKKTLLVPLVLDTYATWRDLHRIPKQAIGEFIYIIFSEKLLSQCTFENIITEIKRECPEDAHAIRICMKKHETK